MAILNTVTPKEDFLVQMNGDYNVPFDEMEVTVKGVAGEIITVGTGFGILADSKEVGAKRVRVLVRGNPTTVNAQALTYGSNAVVTTDAALAKQGIIVVNK